MPCNYHFLSDEGKALRAGPGGEVMNWVKRQNKTPNKCLNKLSDEKEVNWVLPTAAQFSPELQTASQHVEDTVLYLKTIAVYVEKKELTTKEHKSTSKRLQYKAMQNDQETTQKH